MKWLYQLDVKYPWAAHKDGRIALEELTRIISKRLRALLNEHPELADTYIENLADDLENFTGNDADEFDDIWEQVYDWADLERVWVSTVL